MKIVSAALYYLTQHPFWAFPALLLLGAALGWLLGARKRRAGWTIGLLAGAFVLAQLNIFFGRHANALFLDAYGRTGTAVIVDSRPTSSRLNNHTVWEYDAVLKTVDGQDVTTGFSTLTASIHPIRNRILIPPMGQPFVAKYIPGFERNLVIMSDESEYGRQRLFAEALQPLQKAERLHAASPRNPEFIGAYRQALRRFLDEYHDNADPALIRHYQRQLDALEQPEA